MLQIDYISPEFTIMPMYQDFCIKHLDVTILFLHYYKKVKSLNISFVKFGEEECEKSHSSILKSTTDYLRWSFVKSVLTVGDI